MADPNSVSIQTGAHSISNLSSFCCAEDVEALKLTLLNREVEGTFNVSGVEWYLGEGA